MTTTLVILIFSLSSYQDYYEKDEEASSSPGFDQAGKLTDQVKVLKAQHRAGRKLSAVIETQAIAANLKDAVGRGLLSSFNRMYRPHAAWEDTVLYPVVRSVITPK